MGAGVETGHGTIFPPAFFFFFFLVMEGLFPWELEGERMVVE